MGIFLKIDNLAKLDKSLIKLKTNLELIRNFQYSANMLAVISKICYIIYNI